MAKYVCDVCGWEYDPRVGDPENGIAPDNAVTVRDRDTMQQERIPISELKAYLAERIKF